MAGKAVDVGELGRIEAIVAALISQKLPVFAREAPLEAAKQINGLRAVFGEVLVPVPVLVFGGTSGFESVESIHAYHSPSALTAFP